METWQELKVTVKREGEELVSNLLIELGAQGVAIEDSLDYVGNVDRFGEIFPEVEQQEEIVVTAYYPDTVDVTVVEADLQARLAELTDFMDLGELKIGTTALAEEDWADNWKKYYEPARSLAPAVLVGGAALQQVWIFILAPIAGGVLAALVAKNFLGTEE
ncbi:TPA: 50S ribosomal protein L11 methyltransferase [Streptococcus pneumoniae]|nr:50S ribosomal protein L11 methyltransferase [Streptococcus pneumoniae]